MKKIINIALVVLLIIVSGCRDSNKEVSEQPANISENEVRIEKISREEVGLEIIQAHDFNGKNLNNRIKELLKGAEYTDDDMKKGIVGSCIINERFSESIIEDIYIKSPINDVKKLLGEPSVSVKDILFYKSNEYYVAFKGKDKVELVCFSNAPEKEYDKEILNALLNGLCIESIYLTEFLEKNEETANFFEENGFVHGGGNYAKSSNGITVCTLENDMEIYNNFEGNLYIVKPEKDYKLHFINKDSIIEGMEFDISSYYAETESFLSEGKYSPSGKYIAKYEWITSTIHNFTIRATDYSIPDFKIYAAVDNFEWINDDYIVYTAAFSTLPHVIKVERNDDFQEDIKLMKEVNNNNDDDYDYGRFPYNFTILDVKNNLIKLKDSNAEKSGSGKIIWELPYHFDEQGKFILE